MLANAPAATKADALVAAARTLRGRRDEILAANARDLAAARAKGLSPALIDRLLARRTPGRGDGARDRRDRRAARPGWAYSRTFRSAQRPAHRARRDAARRDRRHLREPAQRHRRRRRPVPQERQRGGAARRIGQPPFVVGDSCVPGRWAADRRPAGGGDLARAVRVARGGRRNARRSRRRARRDRAARRPEPGRARPARGAGPGLRPSRGRRACLCRSRRRPRQGDAHRHQFEAAPHRRLRRRRDAAGRQGLRRHPPGAAGRLAARRRLRGARRRDDDGGRSSG